MKFPDRKTGNCVKEMKQRFVFRVLVDNPECPIRDAPALGLVPGVRKVRERICEENDCGATVGESTTEDASFERRQVVP